MNFLHEVPNKPFLITADWLDTYEYLKRGEELSKVYYDRYYLIKGKYVYRVEDGFKRDKYRFLGKCANTREIRIVRIK